MLETVISFKDSWYGRSRFELGVELITEYEDTQTVPRNGPLRDIVGSIMVIKATRTRVDYDWCAEIDFCAVISPVGSVDNQFRCEIRSLVFSCFFCDARNRYGKPLRWRRKYTGSPEAFPAFMSYYVIISRKINTSRNEFPSLKADTLAPEEKGKMSFSSNARRRILATWLSNSWNNQ